MYGCGWLHQYINVADLCVNLSYAFFISGFSVVMGSARYLISASVSATLSREYMLILYFHLPVACSGLTSVMARWSASQSNVSCCATALPSMYSLIGFILVRRWYVYLC